MGSVVDHRVLRARDRAIEALNRVDGRSAYAISRSQAVANETRAVTGTGHPEGDRLAADALRVVACLQRARSATSVAIAETRQVDIMTWVSE